MITEKLVSTKEAAEVLGVSNSTIYRMIEQGLLEPSPPPEVKEDSVYQYWRTLKKIVN